MRHGKTLVVGVGEVGGALAEVLERNQPDLLRHDLERRDFADPIGVVVDSLPDYFALRLGQRLRRPLEPGNRRIVQRERHLGSCHTDTILPYCRYVARSTFDFCLLSFAF